MQDGDPPSAVGVFAMNRQLRCPICDTTAREVDARDAGNRVLWECARCGKYWLFGSARSPIQKSDPKGRPKISSFVYDQNGLGLEPDLTRDFLEQVMSRPSPSVGERAERPLTEIVRSQKNLGDHVQIYMPWWIAATYSLDEDELGFLVRMLSNGGFINLLSETGEFEILPNGHIEADRLKRKVTRSDKGFVAM